MAEDRIYYLMDRLLHNASTEQEKAELARWINLFADGTELKNVLERIWDRYEPDTRMPAEKADRVLSAILQNNAINEPQLPVQVRKMNFRRMAVAASVIAMLGFLAYFLFVNKRPEAVAEMRGRLIREKPLLNDAAPGGNKAVLTLGNGRKIILDNAGNGKLASQGNTQIIKPANGRLVYNGLNEKPDEVVFNTLSTPLGGQFQLTLPDGSQVWLDAASSITYPTAFTGNERKVSISGQAYFEVAENKELPFVVQKGSMSITVLGTHFNVNAYENEGTVKTTLLEGLVKINQGSFTTLIKPGQQIQLTKNGSSRLIEHADLEEAVAWKNGFFKFDHCDLPSVMRQLARWYDVTIMYQGNIPEQHFGGKMQRDLNLSEILDGLEKSGVHFKIEGKYLILMP